MACNAADASSPIVRTCPICDVGCSARDLIGELPTTIQSSRLSRSAFLLTYCSCGELIYISPAPTATDLDIMYQDVGQFGEGSMYRDRQHTAAVMAYMDARFRALSMRLGWTGHDTVSVLEVGAGLAWMSRVAKQINSGVVTVAQDVSAEAVGKCPWVDTYIIGDVTDRRIDEHGPFDIISMTHVIEHLVDPLAVLRRVATLLKPGAILFVTAPHRPVGWQRESRIDAWRQYAYNHVPAHIQYFAKDAMERAAARADLTLLHWDASHEDGQAFEAWLTPPSGGPGVGCDDQVIRAAEPGSRTSMRRLRMLNSDVEELADVYREEFSRALPFRHVCIDHFFEASVADRLVKDFPDFLSQKAINEVGEVGQKAVFEALSDISPFYAEVARYLASDDFRAFVTRVTGIEGLIWAGESMYGGGTHENLDGIDLDPHVDFNYDDRTGLHRRLDILVYLNLEWDEAWGGSLELHSNPRDPANNYVRSFCPAFNRCVIFETNEHSWHGFPRIVLPPDKKHLSRKSLAIYLYTKDRPAEEVVGEHTTFYIQRPIPATVRPGEVLSPDDYNMIQHLVHKRDVFIKVYQDLQVRDGEQKAGLKWKVAQLEEQLKVVQEQNRLQVAKLCEQLAREQAAHAISVAEPTAGKMVEALGRLAGARARTLLSRIPGVRTVVRRSRFLTRRLCGR